MAARRKHAHNIPQALRCGGCAHSSYLPPQPLSRERKHAHDLFQALWGGGLVHCAAPHTNPFSLKQTATVKQHAPNMPQALHSTTHEPVQPETNSDYKAARTPHATSSSVWSPRPLHPGPNQHRLHTVMLCVVLPCCLPTQHQARAQLAAATCLRQHPLQPSAC